MMVIPPTAKLYKQKQYRIIPSVYPPINFFEDLVDPSEMETLWEIESLTNERLLQETGDIFLVPPEDRISGQGSSVIMAAFTHIGKPTRFTDGSFGIYYASLSVETAIRETVHQCERFMRATHEEPQDLARRCYEGTILKPLHDIRDSSQYSTLHHPENYNAAQEFGKELREAKSWGLIYNSVRHKGNHCIAVFRPPAISIPIQVMHLKYIWNSEKITSVFDTKLIFEF